MLTLDDANIRYSGTLLVEADGRLLLQQRDKAAKITNPGMLSLFGGRVEVGESYRQAAIRELNEETNLIPLDGDIHLLAQVPYQTGSIFSFCAIFVLLNIDAEKLTVFEGDGYIGLPSKELYSRVDVTPLCRAAISLYDDIFLNIENRYRKRLREI